ncbi:hypothetical protein M408DRAFT_248887, partial [Serendipita vermifera MAFF 305830]
NLAITYHDLGKLKEAETLKLEVLRLSREILGDKHLNTISASASLAVTYSYLWRLKESEALEVEVLRLREEILGAKHPDTIRASENLAITRRMLFLPRLYKVRDSHYPTW